ncbi:MAG: hypothetical protein HQL07_17395 [Nitrospirae bacterium]|nr:hypothetical protein [Magnetococcales bacterium]
MIPSSAPIFVQDHPVPSMNPWRLLVFVVGVGIFLFIQMITIFVPMLNRDYFPIETDDALAYTQRAKQFEACFFQDCKALMDLRAQWAGTPDSDAVIITAKERLIADSIAIYGPLHSMLQSILRTSGFSWTRSHNILQTATILLFVMGFGYWISGLFGIEAGGITIALLGVLVIHRLGGLDGLVPSFMSSGFALLTWGLLLQFRRRLGFGLLVLIFLILSSHMMVGLLLTGISLAAFWLLDGWRLQGKDRVIFLLGATMAVVTYGLQQWVEYPKLGGAYFPVAISSPGYWTLFQENITHILVQLRDWMGLTGGKFETLAVLILTFLFLPQEKKRPFTLFFVLVSVVCVLTSLIVYAHLRGPVFSRFFIFWAGLMTGAVSYLVWRCGGILLSAAFAMRKDFVASHGFVRRSYREVMKVIGSLLVLTIFAMNVSVIIQESSRIIFKKQHYKIDRFNYDFDEGQVSLLLNGESPCRRVLYGNREAMGIYFVSGAMRCGALMGDLLPANDQDRRSVISSAQISHLVFKNPAIPSTGRLWIDRANLHVRYLGDEPRRDHIRFLFGNGKEEAMIALKGRDDHGTVVVWDRFKLPSKWSGWVTTKALSLAGGAEMEMVQEYGKETQLMGMRLGEEKTDLLWPWKQGLALTYLDSLRGDRPGITKSTRFDFLKEQSIPLAGEVIADRGFSVLATVGH